MRSAEQGNDKAGKHIQQGSLPLCFLLGDGAGIVGIRLGDRLILRVVRGQEGRTAVDGLKRGIAEKYLALNINAVIEQSKLTLDFIRAVPGITGLRFRRTVCADADVQRYIAGGNRLLPPLDERLEVSRLKADRPVQLRTDIVYCACVLLPLEFALLFSQIPAGLTPNERFLSSVCSVSSRAAMSVLTLSRLQSPILLKS